jgi:hypothetical protein
VRFKVFTAYKYIKAPQKNNLLHFWVDTKVSGKNVREDIMEHFLNAGV